MRVEIEWDFYDKELGERVVRWIPGELIEDRADGRKHVVADCGWVALDAAPECVRSLKRREA